MRTLVPLLLLAAATHAGEEWIFSFENGDRVRGGLAAIRNGTVLVAIPAAPSAVTVRFAAISTAARAPEETEEPRPDPQLLRLRDGAALLGWCSAIRQGKVEFETEALGTVTVPSRDIAELLPAGDAVRAYARSLAAAPATSLQPERFDALWTYLGSADGNVAWQAHRDLVRAAESVVPLVDARLRVQPDAPGNIEGWIRSLDADSAEMRLVAYARLRSLGTAAERYLKAALRGNTSAEARQRISRLLADIGEAEIAPDAEIVHFCRAIRVLEEVGTAEAEAVLGRLANGAPDAPTGRDAQAAIQRLRRVR